METTTYQRPGQSTSTTENATEAQSPLILERILQEHGVIMWTVTGMSMMPALRPQRDIVKIQPISRPLKKYDVVLYHINGKYILHRIVSVRNDYYIILGDNNNHLEYVPATALIGIMTAFTRGKYTVSTTNGLYLLYARWRVTTFPLRRMWRRIRMHLGQTVIGPPYRALRDRLKGKPI